MNEAGKNAEKLPEIPMETGAEPEPAPSRKLNTYCLENFEEEEEDGTMIESNYIRRQKRKQMETKREIARMRADLPQYTLHEIRMHKLPFHVALMLQLEETGYESTKAYIEQLFILNEVLRNDAGPMSVLWTKPLLRDSVEELKHLNDALMIAEDFHKNDEYRKEAETILTLAVDIAFKFEGWYWLAKELILQCISIASLNKTTGKHEAMARFIYAKILIKKVHDYDTAELHLNLVREMSSGKSWNLKKILPNTESSNTLFMDVNRLLHECCMRNAKLNFKVNWSRALEYAILAKKRAIEACFYEGETRAFYLKGQCELNLGDFKDAVSTFSKAYHIQKSQKSPKGVCEALMELSKAYLMLGSTELALKTLTELKTLAEQHGFQFYLAQAFRYLGEYYLNCGLPQKASPLLGDALKMFHDTGHPAEADQVRNLGALSSGLELMPVFVPLLQRTDRRCEDWYENLQKVVRWKDSREAFWTNEAESLEVDKISELASIFQE
ncbi:unnamed protein product [Ceutorhynchus assimilis]|uniref:Tetratricopeptide repeat protein 29 n=1 Tax=Ceutorhynchus assimilis TaxID=467358 RepID=A0A9N9MJC7_9CUCU|nr:unnamed protein product [Ceutorhynchus assimilis]